MIYIEWNGERKDEKGLVMCVNDAKASRKCWCDGVQKEEDVKYS